MDKAKVRALTEEIMALPEGEREQLAQEILPLLLGTRAGLEGIDQALQALSDKELDALVERARSRGRDLPEPFVATVIGEALRAARASSRSWHAGPPALKWDLKNVQEDLRILEKYGLVRMTEGRTTGKRRVKVPEALFGEIALKIAI